MIKSYFLTITIGQFLYFHQKESKLQVKSGFHYSFAEMIVIEITTFPGHSPLTIALITQDPLER